MDLAGLECSDIPLLLPPLSSEIKGVCLTVGICTHAHRYPQRVGGGIRPLGNVATVAVS